MMTINLLSGRDPRVRALLRVQQGKPAWPEPWWHWSVEWVQKSPNTKELLLVGMRVPSPTVERGGPKFVPADEVPTATFPIQLLMQPEEPTLMRSSEFARVISVYGNDVADLGQRICDALNARHRRAGRACWFHKCCPEAKPQPRPRRRQ